MQSNPSFSSKEATKTIQDQIIAKLRELPEPLVQEVSDFIDFLRVKQDSQRWQWWTLFNETLNLSELDFSDYRTNLGTYEDRLARGEIQW